MNFKHVTPKDFSGNIWIDARGERIFESYGYADKANKRKNNTDTRFGIASGSKVFVATAILQMIASNRLELGTTIGKIFDWNWHDIDSAITVSQLLNHTSGIPDYYDEQLGDYARLWDALPMYKLRKSSDLIPLFLYKPRLSEPGERFIYNNTGYVVLGLIIEALCKQDFDIYLDKHVFQKASMKNTGFFELDRLPANCANSYIKDGDTGEYYTNIYSIEAKGSGAGGAFTTCEDMYLFWKALFDGTLLPIEWVDEMCKVQAHDDVYKYGYGLWLETGAGNGPAISFVQGFDPGVRFLSFASRKSETIATVMNNSEDDLRDLTDEILKLYFN